MNRLKDWWIFSPVGRFAVLALVLCLTSAALVDLANDHLFDDLPPEAKLALAVPTIAVVSWVTLLLIWTAPRVLGQWIAARKQGAKLAWVVFWPIYIGFAPKRKVLLNWKQPFFRVPRTWRIDGHFDADALRRAAQAGLVGQALATGMLLVASLLAQDAAWHGLLLLLGIFSLVGAFVGSSWDRNLLWRLKQSPDAVEGEDAVMQIRELQAAGVPSTKWPANLEQVALSKAVPQHLRAELHICLIFDAANQGDHVGTMIALERGLDEMKSWPVRSDFAIRFRVQSVYYLAANLGRPDRAQLLLSSIEWPGRYRYILDWGLVVVTACERGASEGQAAYNTFRRSVPRFPWGTGRVMKFYVKSLGPLFEHLAGLTTADFEIYRAWANGIRPRLWERRLIEELASPHDLALRRANRALARLTYWEDTGDARRSEEVVPEILSLAEIENLHAGTRQRLWAEAALFFALTKGLLPSAKDALLKAEGVEFSGKRTLLAAQAAVSALEGDRARALSRLEELTKLLESLPSWATRYEEELERIETIRELAHSVGA